MLPFELILSSFIKFLLRYYAIRHHNCIVFLSNWQQDTIGILFICSNDSIISIFVDVEPPWIQCPGDVITKTDEHHRSANISLSAPVLGDNSGDEVVPFFFFFYMFY